MGRARAGGSGNPVDRPLSVAGGRSATGLLESETGQKRTAGTYALILAHNNFKKS